MNCGGGNDWPLNETSYNEARRNECSDAPLGGGALINDVPNFLNGPFAGAAAFDKAFPVSGRTAR